NASHEASRIGERWDRRERVILRPVAQGPQLIEPHAVGLCSIDRRTAWVVQIEPDDHARLIIEFSHQFPAVPHCGKLPQKLRIALRVRPGDQKRWEWSAIDCRRSRGYALHRADNLFSRCPQLKK